MQVTSSHRVRDSVKWECCVSMRIDARAVGRDRTKEEKQRRHLYGDAGAKFSGGKYGVLLGRISNCITTFISKDALIAEIYER